MGHVRCLQQAKSLLNTSLLAGHLIIHRYFVFHFYFSRVDVMRLFTSSLSSLFLLCTCSTHGVVAYLLRLVYSLEHFVVDV